MNSVDLRSPKLAATCRHPLEAEMLVNELRGEGIDAQTTSTTIAGGAIEFALIDAEVLVPAEDLDRAQQIIARSRQEQANIDWDEVDVGEHSDETVHSVDEQSLETDIARLWYPKAKSMLGLSLAVEVVGLICFVIWLIWFTGS